jgi:hypothetical protein
MLALACVCTAAMLATANASQPDGRSGGLRDEQNIEIAAGGLIFSHNLNLVIDRQDVMISTDLIKVTYAIRNRSSSEQTITVAFPLPDVDAIIQPAVQAEFASPDPVNFLNFAATVDDLQAAYVVEQRAIAVGLDVTKALVDAGLPLFPLADDVDQRLTELAPSARSDVIERGIVRLDDDVVFPAWTLKTTAHWRQLFPAGQTLILSLTYKPIVGRNPVSASVLTPQLKSSLCVDPALEQQISRLATQAPASMAVIAYHSHPNSEALGPVGRFSLMVDLAESTALLAGCLQGLSRSGPTTFDWTAADYAVDEDFRFMVVR